MQVSLERAVYIQSSNIHYTVLYKPDCCPTQGLSETAPDSSTCVNVGTDLSVPVKSVFSFLFLCLIRYSL